MKTSPPKPHASGLRTESAASVATAASIAFPPARSISIPAAEASQCPLLTTAPRDMMTGLPSMVLHPPGESPRTPSSRHALHHMRSRVGGIDRFTQTTQMLTHILRLPARRAKLERREFIEVREEGGDVFGVAPGQRRDRERTVVVRVDLLGEDAARQRALGDPMQEGQRRLELFSRRRAGDHVARAPERTDEPWISRDVRDIVRDLMIIFVFEKPDTADRRPHPEPIEHLIEGRPQQRIVGREHPEL